jgi:DNA processing protein
MGTRESAIPDSDLALAWVLAHPDGGAASRTPARTLFSERATGRSTGSAPPTLDGARLMAARAALERLGWRWEPIWSPSLPAGLRALSDPPLGLFVRGTLPHGPAVAVVGARRASAYGREVAEHLGRELGRAGVCVVSGMARGVDAAAHRGAIAGGGETVAVWGAGPDRVYPAEHGELAEEIAASGALLTEYPPGSPPRAAHFPERNRLIAGLAAVVVVVEADERSGALVTARLALDEGREVMAVPGSIFSRLSAGPNGLLRAGAAPVLTAADVLAVLGVEPAAEASESEPELLAVLPPGEAVSVDHLAALAARPVASVVEELFRLELDGRVVREADGRYRRSRARRMGGSQ